MHYLIISFYFTNFTWCNVNEYIYSSTVLFFTWGLLFSATFYLCLYFGSKHCTFYSTIYFFVTLVSSFFADYMLHQIQSSTFFKLITFLPVIEFNTIIYVYHVYHNTKYHRIQYIKTWKYMCNLHLPLLWYSSSIHIGYFHFYSYNILIQYLCF